MFLFVILLIPFSLCSMERDEGSVVPHNSFALCPVDGSGYVADDEEDLCNFALSSHPSLRKHVSPYLKDILKERDHSPFSDQYESNAQTLRKIKSGEIIERSDSIVYEIILKAVNNALESKATHIENIERKSKQKFSGRKVAAIAATAGAISTAITAICATIISLKAK